MTVNFEFKSSYNINDLLEIVRILREPGGCPWDRQQNHQSIKKNLIEETYEVVEAINKQDGDLLKEELGDVLLQVVFHTQMEKETGGFNFDDVADGICKKLIERHPHVFGDVKAETAKEVLKNWDEIKKKEKGQKNQSEVLMSIPRELPALMRSSKVQQKASKVGFDWPEASGAMDKLDEEIGELKAAVKNGSSDEIKDEFGDLLFSAVNVSRFIGCDAEEALTESTDKFIKRFTLVEKLAKENGVDMKTASPAKLDSLWDEAKTILKSK